MTTFDPVARAESMGRRQAEQSRADKAPVKAAIAEHIPELAEFLRAWAPHAKRNPDLRVTKIAVGKDGKKIAEWRES